MPDFKSLNMKLGCLCVLLLVMSPAVSMARDHDMLFSGQVFSRQAQEIFVPLTNNWQARISMMLPEGSEVKPGDLVVEFDGAEIARQLEQQLVTQRTEQAKTERDIALLEKELVAAEFGIEQADVVLALAVLRADIPSFG